MLSMLNISAGLLDWFMRVYLNNTNITTVTGQAEPESTRPAESLKIFDDVIDRFYFGPINLFKIG